MANLSERLNMKFGKINDSYIILNTKADINYFETLCLICAELNLNLKEIEESDFDATAEILKDFCNSSNEETGFAVSIWFD